MTDTVSLRDLPPLGQALHGGLFAGVTTQPDGTHCAIVLLADAPAKRLTWEAAMKWAESVDAMLPSRPVAALLFANLRGQFDLEWHWTCERFDGSYAWFQYFDDGYQGDYRKRYEGRARAVRLIPLEAP